MSGPAFGEICFKDLALNSRDSSTWRPDKDLIWLVRDTGEAMLPKEVISTRNKSTQTHQNRQKKDIHK